MSEFPFHTAVVDGVEVVGVMFDSSSGRFYEFADPDTHNDRERYIDPRSDDVITYGSDVERMMADILNGRPRALVPATEWSNFRAEYLNAETEGSQVLYAGAWQGSTPFLERKGIKPKAGGWLIDMEVEDGDIRSWQTDRRMFPLENDGSDVSADQINEMLE